jgi:hypothetical protein
MTKIASIVLVFSFFCMSAIPAFAQQPTTAAQPQVRTISFLYHPDLYPMRGEADEFLQGLVRAGLVNTPNTVYQPAAGGTDRQVYLYAHWDTVASGDYYSLPVIIRNNLADFVRYNRNVWIRKIGGIFAPAVYNDPLIQYEVLDTQVEAYFGHSIMRDDGSLVGSNLKLKGNSADVYIIRWDRHRYAVQPFTLLRVSDKSGKLVQVSTPQLLSLDHARRAALREQFVNAIRNPVPYIPPAQQVAAQ